MAAYDERELSVGIVIEACALGFIGILISLSFFIFNVRLRSNRVIKMSSPILNLFIACGGILLSSCCVLYGMDYFLRDFTDAASAICQTRVGLLACGSTLLFGPMFLKSWRVHRLFKNAGKRRVVIKDSRLLLMTGGLLLVDIVLVVIWQTTDPLQFRPVLLYRQMEAETTITTTNNLNLTLARAYASQQPISRVHGCTSASAPSWLAAFLLLKMALLCYGLFLSWQTRAVALPSMNDSRCIVVSSLTTVTMAMVAISVSHVLYEQPNAVYACVVLSVWLCAVVSICMAFIPKATLWWRNPEAKGLRVSLTSTCSTLPLNPVEQLEDELGQAAAQNEVLRKSLEEKDTSLRQLQQHLTNAHKRLSHLGLNLDWIQDSGLDADLSSSDQEDTADPPSQETSVAVSTPAHNTRSSFTLGFDSRSIDEFSTSLPFLGNGSVSRNDNSRVDDFQGVHSHGESRKGSFPRLESRKGSSSALLEEEDVLEMCRDDGHDGRNAIIRQDSYSPLLPNISTSPGNNTMTSSEHVQFRRMTSYDEELHLNASGTFSGRINTNSDEFYHLREDKLLENSHPRGVTYRRESNVTEIPPSLSPSSRRQSHSENQPGPSSSRRQSCHSENQPGPSSSRRQSYMSESQPQQSPSRRHSCISENQSVFSSRRHSCVSDFQPASSARRQSCMSEMQPTLFPSNRRQNHLSDTHLFSQDSRRMSTFSDSGKATSTHSSDNAGHLHRRRQRRRHYRRRHSATSLNSLGKLAELRETIAKDLQHARSLSSVLGNSVSKELDSINRRNSRRRSSSTKSREDLAGSIVSSYGLEETSDTFFYVSSFLNVPSLQGASGDVSVLENDVLYPEDRHKGNVMSLFKLDPGHEEECGFEVRSNGDRIQDTTVNLQKEQSVFVEHNNAHTTNYRKSSPVECAAVRNERSKRRRNSSPPPRMGCHAQQRRESLPSAGLAPEVFTVQNARNPRFVQAGYAQTRSLYTIDTFI
ncbi:uncharacterized protein [Littorina saxatilis]|uniref:G-protein coupled receptors family 3 profile domain-containing protein n=1 Tax=Littorina saxatilis TaxID=31220 RepID=A0AAN9BGR7_9CAEN